MLSICDVIVVKQKSSTGDGGITLYGWGYNPVSLCLKLFVDELMSFELATKI